MAVGFVLFVIAILLLLFGLCFIIVSILLFKKKKLFLAIISLVIGLVFLSPIIYKSIQFSENIIANSKSKTIKNKFIKEYTELNKEFIEIYDPNIKTAIGIYVSIEGIINGKGVLLIIPQPYEETKVIKFDIEGETNKTTNSRRWDATECKIHFIPETENIDGGFLLEIGIY